MGGDLCPPPSPHAVSQQPLVPACSYHARLPTKNACVAPSTPPRPPFSSPFHTTHHTPFRPLLQLPTLDPPSLHNSFNASTQAYRLFSTKTKILYTYTDEAPMYATHSLLPIIQSFTRRVGVEVEKVDLSFTARVLALFPERLTPQQRVADSLAELGKVVKTPVANVIKLPNVSASVPQLLALISELQAKGYNLPNYTPDPKTPEEKDILARYSKALGSAVNPVLREGNSDRRVALPVKNSAKKSPVPLSPFPKGSKARVAHMSSHDFYGSEKSTTLEKEGSVKVEFIGEGGEVVALKSGLKVQKGEVLDASFMSVRHLRAFYEEAFGEAQASGLLVSLHLKATMMKVSDPVLFGHAVSVFYKDVFRAHGDTLAAIKANPNNGLGDVLAKVNAMGDAQKAPILAAFAAANATRPPLAIVDSKKGTTNLHVPSDVIVDASMPNVIRDGGKMWNAGAALQETLAIIPDRCYAGMYASALQNVQRHGQFDPATMGSTANVGLMANKAEEYGSHDKTFILQGKGVVRVSHEGGGAIFEHAVEGGDIWRMCQTKDAPIQDWVKLAVKRARASGQPAIFWLDPARAHDASMIAKVKAYLQHHDTQGLDIRIATPQEAMDMTCARAREGKDTISVTGNVLRDYLTDLFPILELGTSAKMLSIVPMMAGGGMYETGAGGTAPKLCTQLLEENHLTWDSLGEYLALAVSLEEAAAKSGDERVKNLSLSLTSAIGVLLDKGLAPHHQTKQLDNRGSSFFLALFWAQAMAKLDPEFKPLADKLTAVKDVVPKELLDAQGRKVDFGGYWKVDEVKANKIMRPSSTFNAIIDA